MVFTRNVYLKAVETHTQKSRPIKNLRKILSIVACRIDPLGVTDISRPEFHLEHDSLYVSMADGRKPEMVPNS